MAQVKLKTSKRKAAPKASLKVQSSQDQARELIADMISLKAEVAVRQAHLKEVSDPLAEKEKLFKELVDADHAPEEAVVLSNGDNAIKAGACTMTRMLSDVEAAIVALEEVREGLALEIAGFKMGDLEKYLPEDVIAKFTEIKVGSRRLTYDPK